MRFAGPRTAAAGLTAACPVVAAGQDAPALPQGNSFLWTPAQQIVGYRSRIYIRPHRAVQRGKAVHGLPIAIRQISPHWTWDGAPMDVDRYMDEHSASGVIVLKDGARILERYGLGRTAEDRWQSHSVAKSVTAILVGAALQDGYIKSLDTPITEYIPELNGSAYDGVTGRQLLTMTSGVRWNETYSDSNSDDTGQFREPFVNGLDPLVSYMRRLSRAARPGSKFLYKGADPNLAGVMVSRAIARPLSEYLSDKLWRPYGMEKDAFWEVNAAGQEYAHGCIQMTLRDFARIGQFMIEGGKAGGVQVLSSSFMADATRSEVTLPAKQRAQGNIGYGYFWWIQKDSYAAIGYGGQVIFVYPKDKIVISVNSAWLEPAGKPGDWQALRAFVKALHAAAVAQPLGPVRTDCEGC